MAWRCPLCLSDLHRTDRLIHLCPQHPAHRIITCAEENLADVYCDRRECAEVINVEDGVLLSHDGCSASNPFWRPEEAADGRVADGGGVVAIDGRTTLPGRTAPDDWHWQFAMLRQAATPYPNRREMWFPQMLFRAANERQGGRRFGSLVKLCGPRAVGKTTLATMALAYKSYVPPSDSSQVTYADVKDFVYVPIEEGEQNPIHFLNALYPSYLIRRGFGVADWIARTLARRRSIKAAFVHLTLAGARQPALPRPDPPSNFIISALREFAGDLVGRGETSAVPQRTSSRPPIQHSIVFYDSGGEDYEEAKRLPLVAMDWQVDVVAALVSATDLYKFGGGTRPDAASSVAVAVQHLRGVATKRPRRCLVITKLDLIREQVPNDKALLDKIKANEWIDPNVMRQLVMSWLSANDDTERQLRGMLREPPDAEGRRPIDRVFFVWTEPDTERPHQIPHPAGLCNFILWCLDLEPRAPGGALPP